MTERNTVHIKFSQRADFLVREKVFLAHAKQQQCIWLELSNAFDCLSQKENILLNTVNKRIIGVLTDLDTYEINLSRILKPNRLVDTLDRLFLFIFFYFMAGHQSSTSLINYIINIICKYTPS
jgi:hypothetical protein